MKNDLTTGAWQHNIGCPISITLFSTSDEMAILQGVNGQNKGREVDQDIDTRRTNTVAAGLRKVSTEAVEGDDNTGHVKSVPDKDMLTI